MENYNVYEDIANRTNGDIYIGVVGPVRTGKSTFIKRFMETLVIPSAAESDRAVMIDELPQSGSGKTVMTTEPKFVPAKAAKIAVSKGAEVAIRLVDCVGFAVEGANGFEEDGAPRLIKTPWQELPMPFEKAAEMGTEKVIQDHSTIGVLVTTDGSVTDIPRSGYIKAEERAVRELKALEKPFVIILNCADPSAQTGLRESMEEKYGTPVVAVNVEKMGEDEILCILQKALFEFPVTRIDVRIPKWLQSLPENSRIVSDFMARLKEITVGIVKMRDCFALERMFEETSDFTNPVEIKMDLGRGKVEVTIGVKDALFYQILSEESGEEITDDLQLMKYVRGLACVRRDYEKVSEAFMEAEKNGYGIVYPTEQDFSLEKPQLLKRGAGYGVQFKATAASYHILKVDVVGEVNPIIGTKQQGEDFVGETLKVYEEGEEQVWETNIFGKSLRALVADELSGKTNAMPIELRRKMRRAVTRIVNEGKGNVICILF